MNRQTRQRPVLPGRWNRNSFDYGSKTTTGSARLPSDWRARIEREIDPHAYFSAHVERLSTPNAAGFATAKCPFHDDRSPSLSVKLSGRGHWECHAGSCGLKGYIIEFHQRVTGLGFVRAVRDLLGLHI